MNIRLKPGKDKPVRNGHPWIFSGAVARVDGEINLCDRLCTVYNANGERLGIGYYNDKSTIRVRMLSVDTADDTAVNTAVNTDKGLSKRSGGKSVPLSVSTRPALPLTFTANDLRNRVRQSIDTRKRNGALTEYANGGNTDSCRLVNSEGDFLPGLIVDKYGPGLCIQIGTAGMECWRGAIIDALLDIVNPAFIYERSDTASREREGLSVSEGLIAGALPETLVITENGVRYRADLRDGQKTGFFFDQRENRALLRRYAAGRNVCDCFSYSGGFAINAALGGAASVVAVDSSEDAGACLSENARLNGVSGAVRFLKSDAFAFLRRLCPGGGDDAPIDLLILDPPKFARHHGDVDRAARGYKDINLAALRALAPGGLLFTFSCSGAVDPYLFRQIVFGAAADARRGVQILHVLTAGPDHPVSIAHLEGEYLKGLVLRVQSL
ncbi:MAG: class I SAM-dependent rRNA methyltransferase [Chitinispirillales bacterium]|nr:class I SAM-dependent rRNA methyltransferase [Chitinispirillales bacterium]